MTLHDLRDLDFEMYKSLMYVLENEGAEGLCLTFTRPAVGGGRKKKGKKKTTVTEGGGGGGGSSSNPPADQDAEEEEIELKPNGKNIDVTDTNKDEYASLLLHAYTHTTYGAAAQAMRQGLLDVLLKNHRLLRLFNPPEFSVVVGGIGEIDVHDWQAHTDKTGFASADGHGDRVIQVCVCVCVCVCLFR